MSAEKSLPHILHEWTAVLARQNFRDFRDAIEQAELSPSQMSTLFRLHFGGMCGVSDIAGHLGVTDPAASQMVEKLVQRRMVERSEDPTDRRARRVCLTPAGAELVESVIAQRRRWMERLTGELSPEQQQTVASALEVLIEAARRLEAEAQAGDPAGPHHPSFER